MMPLEPSLGFEVESSFGVFIAKTTSGAHRAESLSHPECVSVCVCVCVCAFMREREAQSQIGSVCLNCVSGVH